MDDSKTGAMDDELEWAGEDDAGQGRCPLGREELDPMAEEDGTVMYITRKRLVGASSAEEEPIGAWQGRW